MTPEAVPLAPTEPGTTAGHLERAMSAAHRAAGSLLGRGRSALRLAGRYDFTNRSNGSSTLLIVLIGYKPELWPLTVPAISEAVPEGADVCLVSPGTTREDVTSLARTHGWSHLATATNDVSLAQNIAIRLHQRASTLIKVDEDMFLLPDTLTETVRFQAETRAAGVVDPGFTAPMIPINGTCYRPVLQALGRLEEYESLFSRAVLRCSGIPIQNDAEAARWMWNATGPLAKTLEAVRSARLEPIQTSIRFSIGTVVFERQFWEEFGMFPVRRDRILAGRSTLGDDEFHLCASATSLSRPGVVCPTSLAGHFSFGPQYAGMRRLLDEDPELFATR